MNKNDLRVIKTKKNIHESLLNLLKSKPLAQIKITELCKEANINRGTFYFHYQQIEEVFEELFGQIIQDLKDSYNEPYKHTENFVVEKIDPSTVRIFHHIKKYEAFYKIVFSKEISSTYYYILFDEVKNLMKDRHAMNHNVFDEYLFAYQANAIIGLIIEWYRRDFNETVEEMNIKLMDIVNYKLAH